MHKFLFRILCLSLCSIHVISSVIAMEDLFPYSPQNDYSYNNFISDDIDLDPMFSDNFFLNESTWDSIPSENNVIFFEPEWSNPTSSASNSSPILTLEYPNHLQDFNAPVFQEYSQSASQLPRVSISQPTFHFPILQSNSVLRQPSHWQHQSYNPNPQQASNRLVFIDYSFSPSQISVAQTPPSASDYTPLPLTPGLRGSSQNKSNNRYIPETTNEQKYQEGFRSTNLSSQIEKPLNDLDNIIPEHRSSKTIKSSKKRKKVDPESADDFKFIEIVKKRKHITESPKIEPNGVVAENKKNEDEDKKKYVLKIKIVRKDTDKIDPKWKLFQDRIPYTLTDGQNSAIRDINADMRSKNPMERVIIAPVGAGKTEVAKHATFKAIQTGKQVIILCPRCELARQHFENFKERFKDIAEVVHIPRSYTQSEKNWVYSRIKKGRYNIIIGTHGLLNDQCEYKDLGLIIIDEEQAFGVKQKEFLNNKYPDAHTLILTATPIPRTQELIKLGYYQSTVIETLPQGRLPIEVDLSPDINTSLSKINSEKERGGQTFFVTSKIANIPSLESFLIEKCPHVSYRTLHGKMSDKDQAETLQKFREGAFDVLVSTNIIGIGIDIPMANTIIIDDANRFGLGELYQMKGRVGRSEIQGKALLLYNEKKITDTSLAKLRAIQKFSRLNDCKNISEIDLELRGGGDVLNIQQHGHRTNQSTAILEAYLKGSAH